VWSFFRFVMPVGVLCLAAVIAAEAQDRPAGPYALTSRSSELARLEPLFSKVCAAHGEGHPELVQMQSIFRGLNAELQLHMMKEENVLFPYLAAMEKAALSGWTCPRAMFGTVQNPVRMMTLEHDSAGDALRELRQASGNYTVPIDACVTFGELYRALQALEADLHTHIHLENNILFPRAVAMEAAAA